MNMWRKGRRRWARWVDEWKLAGAGLLLATRRPRFVAIAAATFLAFGTLMNLLAGGTAAFSLLATAGWGGKLRIIGDALLAVFGVGRSFWDWALVFGVALLQGVLAGLVAVVWRARRLELARSAAKRADEDFAVTDDVQRTGLAAGLAVLGAGCPTCGTTLLGPLVGAVSGSGGLALAGALSGLMTVLSVVIALVALRKIGKEAFVELVKEKRN